MLDARFSHLYFFPKLIHAAVRFPAIAGLLVKLNECSCMLQRACALVVAIFDLVYTLCSKKLTQKFKSL